MKYSLIQNIKFVYQYAFSYNKKLKINISVFILASIAIPIIATVIPSVVVLYITSGYKMMDFVYMMGGLFLGYGIFMYIKQYLSNTLNFEYTLVRITEFIIGLYVKTMKTDYINVEPQEKQVILQKALNSLGSNWVGVEFMFKNFPDLIINLIGLLIYGSLISVLNPIIIVILVVMTILNILLNTYAQHYEEKHKSDYAKLDRQINYLYQNSTSLINGKDVRIYKIEDWFYQLFHLLTKKRIEWSRKIEYRYFLPHLSDNIILMVRDLIAYSILINLVLSHQIDVAQFTLFVGVIAYFSTWLNQSVTAFANIKRANLGINDLRAYLDIDEIFNHGEGSPLPVKEDLPLEIKFDHVSFRYPQAEKDTLHDLNFTIHKGSKIALVGNNGAGKTTLVKLLSGLYYPTEGDILVNGTSIKDYNINEYQRLVGVVFQDVEILAFTIAKNIAGSHEINDEKVQKVILEAGLKDKIDKLKNKEKTYITQTIDKEGILLSGGEMQKLMLARALYKDAPLLVLDEPTAALDPLAEADIYGKYNELTQNKTSLFISHRLSSTQFCNRILFLENGTILEDGTHAELMTLDGKYAEMFKIQSHYYKENNEVMDHE